MRVEFIFTDEFVGHGNSQGLHWVANSIVESSDHVVVVIHDVLLEIHQPNYILSSLNNPFELMSALESQNKK
jgi:hypothetical protein